MGRLRRGLRSRLVALGALTAIVLSTTACSSAPRAGALPSASVAPSVQVGGRTIPFDSVQRWRTVTVPSRESPVLTVFVIGSDDGGGPCGPPVIRLVAAESENSVRVTAAAYQRPSSEASACSAIGYAPSPHQTALQRPLGDRTVIDASDGETRSLLVGSDLPRLGSVPRGFDASPLAAGQQAGASEQWWTEHGESVLRLTTVPPAATREIGPYGRIVRQAAVRGVPAAVYQDGTGRYGQLTVQWTPNRRQTISLQLGNSAHRRWSVEQALAIASTVVGYRVQQTGRLPQPTTPGTAAASYSSADGPVRHAPNLLKSSGVWIGVDCQGEGAVTVSLRGASRRFDCTPKLSHHVEKSVGDPNEQFFVDISATDGVRWAVTLARASLDGS